jgi:hypothetical protein
MSYVSPFTGDVVQPTDVSLRVFALTADTSLAWPINGNTSGNYAARIMEVTPNAAGRSLLMPPANQTSPGTDSLIRNLSANSFTVKNAAGGTIVVVAPGKAQYVYVVNNTTLGGTWGVIDFGAGTSAADANTLAGFGLIASSATLNQSHPTVGISTGHTFSAVDRAQVLVWSSGVGNVTLPLASGLGNNWFTLLKNNGTGTLTVNTTSGQEIDNEISKSFNPGESAFIVCTGTEYITVGYGQSSTFVFSALVKSVSAGNYTLTANEASNLIQEYIGSLTNDVTITFPAIVNFYVISNQTTANGHQFTVTTGVAGGSDAIIPSGQQATLVCDGINFFNANTIQAGATSIQVVNGTVTNPSISFGAEPTTGIYRPAIGEFGITVLGSQKVDIDASGMQVTGTGNFTGGIAGGTY